VASAHHSFINVGADCAFLVDTGAGRTVFIQGAGLAIAQGRLIQEATLAHFVFASVRQAKSWVQHREKFFTAVLLVAEIAFGFIAEGAKAVVAS